MRPRGERLRGAVPDQLRHRGLWLIPALMLAGAIVAVVLATGASNGLGRLAVYPIPGSRVAMPWTQIVLRGLPTREIGSVRVTGRQSGSHTGKLVADSDGDGGSFLPTRPFAPGEIVTVQVTAGGGTKTWQFEVARPVHPIGKRPLRPLAPRRPGDVLSFHSQPKFAPPTFRVDRQSPRAAPGDIFITPQKGPVQNGNMIVDSKGRLVWWHPIGTDQVTADFRVQRYRGQPVLTFFQGWSGSGVGTGVDHILNSHYQQVALVRAGNGFTADLHEFKLLPGGKALITGYMPVEWDASAMGGWHHQTVDDSVVQEIDVKTGLVLFQWDSLDHIPVTDSNLPPTPHGGTYDYFHTNSVQMDRDGNLIISSRNTWSLYKVSIRTGQIMWTLGGRKSDFKMGPGAQFAFQHAAYFHGPQDRILTVYDDGAGPPNVHKASRGLALRVNFKSRTVSVIQADFHAPPLLSQYEGNLQLLPNGDQFVAWGEEPYFTEFSHGKEIYDAHLVTSSPTYRAYRFRWSATPAEPPAVAATRGGGGTRVYASWNGATNVAYWQVLAGSAPGALHVVGTTRWQGFETRLSAPAARYVAVRALDAQRRPLATSHTIQPS